MRAFYLVVGSLTVLLAGAAFCLYLTMALAPTAQETLLR